MVRTTFLILCALALSACVHSPPRNPMAEWVPSPNHDQRRPVVIVLHYTEQESVEQSLHTLRTRNSGGPVSSHYLVGDDGAIYQLVADAHRAWHAGGGRWARAPTSIPPPAASRSTTTAGNPSPNRRCRPCCACSKT